MLIKKLSKEEKKEGITLDMVNQLPIDKNLSPIQLQCGDEPVEILQCSTGWWVMYELGRYLKDENGKLIVVSDRDVRIGRARYLMNFGHLEKKKKVNEVIALWDKEICENIKIVITKRDEFAELATLNSDSILYNLLLINKTPEEIEECKEEHRAKLEKIDPLCDYLKNMYDAKDFIPLLEYFKIESFSNPMLSINTTDNSGLDFLKNTFSLNILEENDFDMVRMYALIKVEKEYYNNDILQQILVK